MHFRTGRSFPGRDRDLGERAPIYLSMILLQEMNTADRLRGFKAP